MNNQQIKQKNLYTTIWVSKSLSFAAILSLYLCVCVCVCIVCIVCLCVFAYDMKTF